MPEVTPTSAPTTPGGPAPLVRFSSAPGDVVGRLLDGRYLIERVLGEGAMAVVLAARHTFLDTRVAVKMLHPALVAVPEMRERFLREARVTIGVAHDGLVRVSDFGVSPEGLHYLVMERLEGEDLLTWSERRGQASAEECAAIALQVCEALTALHGAGYVHRDLKPENLWVLQDASGALRIKVLDLGIAGLIESAGEARVGRKAAAVANADAGRLTQAGQTLGTALYMSPEQTMGNPLDERSDLYSLGCVMWELATDRCAFEAPTVMDIMLKQMSEVAPAPSTLNGSLPPWFDRIVAKLLAKKPEDRFQSARETATALVEALGGRAPTLVASTVVARAPSEVTVVARRPRRALWAMVAAVAIGVIAGAAWAFTRPTEGAAGAPIAVGRALAPVAIDARPPAERPAWLTAARPETAVLAPVPTPPVTSEAQTPKPEAPKDEVPRKVPVKITIKPGTHGEADGATGTPASTDGLWQPQKPSSKPDASP